VDTIWKPHVVAAAVIEKDGKFLCVEEDIEGAIVINQPAGHLDPGETLIAAAERETVEETGWTVEVSSLVGIYLMETEITSKTILRFCFAADAVAFDAERRLDAEIVGTHWFDREELEARRASHRSPLVMHAVDDFRAGQRFPLTVLNAFFRS
jgi:8-oxo-dGTP pyrophosphatase MutT (NUDIX family)